MAASESPAELLDPGVSYKTLGVVNPFFFFRYRRDTCLVANSSVRPSNLRRNHCRVLFLLMTRLKWWVALLVTDALFLTGCASDDSFSSDGQGESAVAGEATPRPQAPGGARAGWAW